MRSIINQLRDYKQNKEDYAANLRFIRYAGVLLLYAEIINEIEGQSNNVTSGNEPAGLSEIMVLSKDQLKK